MKSQISKLIPKGKGYNIANYYKNGGKTKGLFARYAKAGNGGGSQGNYGSVQVLH